MKNYGSMLQVSQIAPFFKRETVISKISIDSIILPKIRRCLEKQFIIVIIMHALFLSKGTNMSSVCNQRFILII